MSSTSHPDVIVVGAGVFGAWTACCLQRAGRRVLLLDGHGPGNSRSSSGGESRIIRMGYGPDEIYTRWAARSLAAWQELFDECARDEGLFHRTGMLWMAPSGDEYALQTIATLRRAGVACETIAPADFRRRWPQISCEGELVATLEPESGMIMARRAVQRLVAHAVRQGVMFGIDRVDTPSGEGTLKELRTASGQRIGAEAFVFACGPWLPSVFPRLLAERIHPTRQEVVFFGVPSGDCRFSPPAMPAWADFVEGFYGGPDLEHRGFKVGIDAHGPAFDPESGSRVASQVVVNRITQYAGRRFPALADAPVVESRVCQYENTSSGDFLIDRHPDFENVWLVGGGSGHGFKHGPAVGEYLTGRILGASVAEPRFALETKDTVRKRAVF